MTLPPGAARRHALYQVAVTWTQTDPASASRWAGNLPAGNTRLEIWREIAGSWADTDLDAAGAWLGALPLGRDHDEAVLAYVPKVEPNDPAKALSWAGTISDAGSRAEQVQTILERWSRRDAAAAHNWAAASGVAVPGARFGTVISCPAFLRVSLSQHSSAPVLESGAGPGTHRRGWFFACLYWTAQGIYGLFAATLCYFVFGVAVSIALPVLIPLAAHLIAAGVGVVSVLVGVQAGYRNHCWIQRRKYAKTIRPISKGDSLFPSMGHSFAMLTLRNPRYPDFPPVEVEALADTGATFLCIAAEIAEVLRLEAVADCKEAVFADGRQWVPYVGPVEARFKGRVAFGGALVTGEQILLGAIPMEDMDLVVLPRSRRVDVNPESPEIASCLV